MAIPHYLSMVCKLQTLKAEFINDIIMHETCEAALGKLNTYHTIAIMQTASHSNVATMLDPRMNLQVYDKLMPDNNQQCRRNLAKAQFQAVYSRYSQRQRDIEAAQMLDPSDKEDESVAYDSDDELFASRQFATDFEYTRWFKEHGPTNGMDTLVHRKSKQYEYLVLVQVAQDYLAIPATSTASERVFSVGGDIIIKKRNRLAPETVRYLLCLWDWGVIEEDDPEEERA